MRNKYSTDRVTNNSNPLRVTKHFFFIFDLTLTIYFTFLFSLLKIKMERKATRIKTFVVPQTHNALLSPPCAHQRRRSSVMFSDVILLHGSSVNTLPGSIGMAGERNVCSSEKMTQTGDGNVWATPQPNNVQVCFDFLNPFVHRRCPNALTFLRYSFFFVFLLRSSICYSHSRVGKYLRILV